MGFGRGGCCVRMPYCVAAVPWRRGDGRDDAAYVTLTMTYDNGMARPRAIWHQRA